MVIPTKNEEKDIGNCLESVKWADEIVIVDDYSSDNTVQICRRYTDKIFFRKMSDFSQQRSYALSLASGPWILSLDADDTVTPELAAEIQALLKEGSPCDGFMIYRTTDYLGRRMRYCGWRSRVMVLFKKEKAEYGDELVHEKIRVSGKIGYLKNEIRHNAYKNISEHFPRIDLYTSYGAEQLYRKGIRLESFAYPFYFFFKPVFTFFKKYVIMQGFREGVRGFIISAVTAFIVLMDYAKLWEKQKK